MPGIEGYYAGRHGYYTGSEVLCQVLRGTTQADMGTTQGTRCLAQGKKDLRFAGTGRHGRTTQVGNRAGVIGKGKDVAWGCWGVAPWVEGPSGEVWIVELGPGFVVCSWRGEGCPWVCGPVRSPSQMGRLPRGVVWVLPCGWASGIWHGAQRLGWGCFARF